MTNSKDHPEQDPAEGSRETIEHELARTKDKAKKDTDRKESSNQKK